MLSSVEEGYKPQLFLTCSVHYTQTPLMAMCGCNSLSFHHESTIGRGRTDDRELLLQPMEMPFSFK